MSEKKLSKKLPELLQCLLIIPTFLPSKHQSCSDESYVVNAEQDAMSGIFIAILASLICLNYFWNLYHFVVFFKREMKISFTSPEWKAENTSIKIDSVDQRLKAIKKEIGRK